MPRVWGSWAGPSSTGARYRLGFDYEISGTTVTVQRYVAESEYSIAKSVTLTRSGALSGSYSVSFSTSGGVVDLGRGGSFTVAYGASKTVGGKLTNVLHGLEPSVSQSITVPARVPGKPGKPTISSITSSSWTAKTTAPASNGASITSYIWDWEPGSGTTSSSGTSRSFTGFAANTQYRVRVLARNSVGDGPLSDWSSYFTTKPLAPSAPAAPSITRVSDTQHTVSWSRVASTARPITSQRVQRRTSSTDGGGSGEWATIATISGSYTSNGSHSYSDKSTVAGRAYQYRIQQVNSAGTTTGASTGWVFTTPPVPTTAKATKNSAGNIVVSWTPGSPLYNLESRFYLQRSENGGGTWINVGSFSGGTTSYTHTSPSVAVTHTYRVRTYIDYSAAAAGNGLTSGYRQTNTVQLAAPPNAPTILGPSGAQNASTLITLSWQHNPVDSSDQRQYRIAWRYQGDTSWNYIGPTVSEDSLYVVPADTWVNGNSVEWQVQTWGQHATGSPYSATGVFPLSSPPEATIISPAPVDEEQPPTVWTEPTVTVTWEYFDAEEDTQSAWEMQLVDPTEDTVVETRTGVGDDTSATFAYTVPDGSSWTVRVRLRDGAGMWSEWAESTFVVDYPEPPVPIVSAVWDPILGGVEVGVENLETAEPYAVYNDIYRSIDDGEWVLIATQVPVNSTVTDFQAASVGVNRYRATAWSELPSASESEVYELLIERDDLSSGYLGAGPGYATTARALYDLRVEPSGGKVRVQHQFAGRADPVEFSGTARHRQLDISFVVLPAEDEPDASLLSEWEALEDLRGPHLWRDPEGRRMYGTISDLSYSPLGEGAYTVSFSITRTGPR